MLWNRDMVAAYLQEAAATMRSLPAVKVQGHFNVWPPVLQNFSEAYASTDEMPRRGPRHAPGDRPHGHGPALAGMA